jgi:hypothetical protein
MLVATARTRPYRHLPLKPDISTFPDQHVVASRSRTACLHIMCRSLGSPVGREVRIAERERDAQLVEAMSLSRLPGSR